MQKLKRIGLTVKPYLTEKEETIERLLTLVRNTGAEVFIDRKNLEDVRCVHLLPQLEDDIVVDAMLVVGGDGTILRSVRELKDFRVPLITVNKGVVGFLAELSLEEAETMLSKMLAGEYVIEERTMLSVEVLRRKKTVFSGLVLNEAAISQGNIARLLDLRTSVNNNTLATYHADGLIIATPTGSTAYSLAAGGPVVHPRLSAMILTPINPHSLTQKPIVIPGESVVETEVQKHEEGFLDTRVSLTLDGQVYEQLSGGDVVRVRMHEETAKFVRREHDKFYHALRTKLRWGERI